MISFPSRTYIPCACYVLYNIFFADFNTNLAVFTWGIFFHTLIILVIICKSAADVNTEVGYVSSFARRHYY